MSSISIITLHKIYNYNFLINKILCSIGNYPLCRVLPQMYAVNKEPLHDHAMALVSLLPLCDNAEKLALLNLFALIAKDKPQVFCKQFKPLDYYSNE